LILLPVDYAVQAAVTGNVVYPLWQACASVIIESPIRAAF